MPDMGRTNHSPRPVIVPPFPQGFSSFKGQILQGKENPIAGPVQTDFSSELPTKVNN